jgi:hypothetical protein
VAGHTKVNRKMMDRLLYCLLYQRRENIYIKFKLSLLIFFFFHGYILAIFVSQSEFMTEEHDLRQHHSLRNYRWCGSKDRLCRLVARGPGFDSRPYQIFWEVVGLERVPLSLVSVTEELLEWKSSSSRSRKQILTALGIWCTDHVTPSVRKSWH